MINEYQNLFVDKKNYNKYIKKKKMFINFKLKVKVKLIKIYLLKQRDRKIINKIFDKLHAQNKIHFIFQFTFFNYLIFVV